MEKIGHYTFIRSLDTKLGSGSYSTVYSGVCSDPNSPMHGIRVAIKIIDIGGLTLKAKSILKNEIYVMELIKNNPHPNIVECYDVIQSSIELFIIMEFCSSGDLRSILKKPIKEKFAQFYFCQLVNGLKYLDKHKIIHRDIKPKNILLTNERKFLKIADFGFAKNFSSCDLHETICGSPLYMAPELFNETNYNNQSDLWSIGMILYEMLYGSNPYEESETINQLQNMINTKIIDIPPKNTLNVTVSNDCLILIRRLLEKDVKKRLTWIGFFDYPWVKVYDCSGSQAERKSYEDELYSTSLGSLSDNSPTIAYFNKATNGSIISRSYNKNYKIIDNFIDGGSKNSTTVSELKKKNDDDLIFKFDSLN